MTGSVRAVRGAAAMVLCLLAACQGGERIAGVSGGPGGPTYAGYPGLDIGTYPGDAMLSAWRFPTSPYYWTGYYLAAPCHRDLTWMGTRATVAANGWGTAVLYVGQQDWSRIPDIVLMNRLAVHGLSPSALPALTARVPNDSAARAARAASAVVTCSASLLTTAQGALDAADAATKTAAEGFARGSAIYLDVEYVTSTEQPLLDYVRAWFDGILADGRFVPAVYVARSNAAAVAAVATASFAAAGRTDAPRFWIASSADFALTRAPTDVGLSYATVWQGGFERIETWGGITKTIDQNVAALPSPSAPPAP